MTLNSVTYNDFKQARISNAQKTITSPPRKKTNKAVNLENIVRTE